MDSIPGLGIKIPHGAGQLNLCAATTKAHALEPASCRKRIPCNEHPNEHSPHMPQRGKTYTEQQRVHAPQQRPSATKNNYFFKVQASWFPNCVPWGVLRQHNQLGRAGCFNKFLRETQKHSTWIRHKQTTGPKQSQCPPETSVHSLLMTLSLCKVDMTVT